MLVRPRAILFDLDETLLNFGQRVDQIRAALAACALKHAPLSQDEVVEAIEAAFRAHWADEAKHRAFRAKPLIEARRHIAREAFAALEALGCPPQAESAAVAFAEQFHAAREAQVRPYPDALPVLDALRRRGVRLALVTNGQGEVQRPKIDRFDLARRFDHIQIEGEHGFGKPEARCYRHALEAVGAAAHEAWMVGDNLEWEVVAPQKLGLTCVWFDPRGAGLPEGSTARPDRIIRELTELLEAVGEPSFALAAPSSPRPSRP